MAENTQNLKNRAFESLKSSELGEIKTQNSNLSHMLVSMRGDTHQLMICGISRKSGQFNDQCPQLKDVNLANRYKKVRPFQF